MGKLQMIKRANSTVSYSVNIPLVILTEIGWEKGDKLEFHIVEDKIIISREDL